MMKLFCRLYTGMQIIWIVVAHLFVNVCRLMKKAVTWKWNLSTARERNLLLWAVSVCVTKTVSVVEFFSARAVTLSFWMRSFYLLYAANWCDAGQIACFCHFNLLTCLLLPSTQVCA